MDRALPAIVSIAIIALALGGMLLGWRALARRSGSLPAPAEPPASLSAPLETATGLHAATTLAREPLRRVAVAGLAFRARAELTVHAEGLVIAPRGERTLFIPASDLTSLARATWTIDKGVESDGLTVIEWRLGETDLDTYVRVDGSDDALIRAAGGIIVGEQE